MSWREAASPTRRPRPTPREFEILRMLLAERSTGDIAASLRLSPKTVANTRYLTKSKLGVASDVELVLLVLREGIFGEPSRMARLVPAERLHLAEAILTSPWPCAVQRRSRCPVPPRRWPGWPSSYGRRRRRPAISWSGNSTSATRPSPSRWKRRWSAGGEAEAEQQVVLAPQPKAALTAAMPAQNKGEGLTAPVHLGETFGVTPNPNATRPATVAAIGIPMAACRARRLRRTAWLVNRHRQRPQIGLQFRNCRQGGFRGYSSTATNATTHLWQGSLGRHSRLTDGCAGQDDGRRSPPRLEVLSKPPVQYTSEARQLKVEGDVILRVTLRASGQVEVQGVVHGLGHGLDEEARRVAQQIRFRPATRNGRAGGFNHEYHHHFSIGIVRICTVM